MSGCVISVLDMGSEVSSLITAGLSIALKQESKKRTALLDFSLFPIRGKMKILFNLSEEKSLIPLLPFIDQLDAQMMDGYFVSHTSGVDLLNGCFKRNEMIKIKPEYLSKIVSFLPQMYAYTLISLDNDFNEAALALLDSSNLIILIITPDYLSLEGAKEVLSTLYSFHYAPQSIKIVLNGSNIEGALSLSKIEEHLKEKIFYKVQRDSKFSSSSVPINKGGVSNFGYPRSHFYNAIQGLTRELLGGDTFIQERLGQRRLPFVKKRVKDMTQSTLQNDSKENNPCNVLEVMFDDKTTQLKSRIKKRLIKEMDLKGLDFREAGNNFEKQEEIKQKVKEMVERLLNEEGEFITIRKQREKIVLELLDDILGLGPLEKFLRDPSVSEIMVNQKNKVYIEQEGKIKLTDVRFISNQQILTIIERIIAPLGRRIDESSPLVDARLKGGSRVNAIISPLALDGPTITIRKFKETRLTPEDLINLGSTTREMIEFIQACVKLRKNIVISGGTGSGKTTFLNIVSSFIPNDERIITIEDSAELKLPQEHVIRLESRPPNIEGGGEISIRRLVINCLRMRPDRIIIGECRGGEAIDMLQAMNTGHEGSLTTLHANSPRDALARLETMVLMSGIELPLRAIREQIASAIDIIVQQSRFSDGTRKVTNISEVTGLEGNTITTAGIFKFVQQGIDYQGRIIGEFEPTGIVPSFVEEINSHGVTLDTNIFRDP